MTFFGSGVSAVILGVVSLLYYSISAVWASPSTLSTFSYHPRKMPWNDARRTCQGLGGDLVRPDTNAKLEALQVYSKTLWKSHTQRYYWIGLHSSPQLGLEYAWPNCDLLDDVAHWSTNEGGISSESYCVTADRAGRHTWAVGNCSQKHAFVCEISKGGECKFEIHEDYAVARRKYNSGVVVVNTLNCAQECLSYSQGLDECWLYTKRNTQCKLFTGENFGLIHDDRNWELVFGHELGRKVCFLTSKFTGIQKPITGDVGTIPETGCVLTKQSITTTVQSVQDETSVANLPAQSAKVTEKPEKAASPSGSSIPMFGPTFVSLKTSPIRMNSAEYTTSMSSPDQSTRIALDFTSADVYYKLTTALYITAATKRTEDVSTSLVTNELRTLTSMKDPGIGGATLTTVAPREPQHSTVCVCPCGNTERVGVTGDMMEQILSSMDIPREKFPSFRRKLTSAPDSRVSSVACGTLGILVMSLLLSCIILADISTWCTRRKSH